MFNLIRAWRRPPPKPAPPPVVPESRAPLAISANALLRSRAPKANPRRAYQLVPPQLPPGVLPRERPRDMANDDACMAFDLQSPNSFLYSWGNDTNCGLYFPGYPYLAELSQRSEFRSPTETIAKEMTRKWIELKSIGGADHGDKLREIMDCMTAFGVQDKFRRATELDGFMGRGQIYIDIKDQNDDDTRKLPLVVNEKTIHEGDLLALTVVEPMWTTPYSYNSSDPTREDFFVPRSWFVMGKRIDASRLLTFISRPVPDMLKPSYNFGGIAMSQLVEVTVNKWLRTRDAVNDLVHNFSIIALKTNMSEVISGGPGDNVMNRAQLFMQMRDNQGLWLMDKDAEELDQIAVPLGTLDHLQAQAQEHMAAPAHIPLVKLFGITPSGLNASSEGEIAVFYDYISAEQEALYSKHLTTILQIIQLHLYGTIDPSIGFDFVPLADPDSEALARIRKSDADAGVAYINAGVVGPDEERERLADSPDSGYNNLTGPPPEPPADPNADPNASGGGEGGSEKEGDAK